MLKKPKKIKGEIDLIRAMANAEMTKDSSRIRLGDFLANPDLLSDEQSMWDSRTEENEEKKELVKTIKDALPVLSSKEARVVELLWDGKTHSQVASILNISTGNVYNLLQRARRKIIKIVG